MAYLLYNIVYNIEAMSHGTFEFKLVKCFSPVFDKKKKRSLTILDELIISLDLFQWQEMHAKSFHDVYIWKSKCPQNFT